MGAVKPPFVYMPYPLGIPLQDAIERAKRMGISKEDLLKAYGLQVTQPPLTKQPFYHRIVTDKKEQEKKGEK